MHYIINQNTLFIQELETLEIYEKDQKFLYQGSLNKILDESCNYYGSSFQGRKKATKYLIGITSKAPIILSESQNLFLFPIFSSRNKVSLWFVYNNILSYRKNERFVDVTFKNNQQITFLISYNIFHNQLLKCSYLYAIANLKQKSQETR